MLRYDEAIGGEPTDSTGRDRREVRGRDVLHQRHHRPPQRRGLQPPFELSAHDGGLYGQRHGAGVQRHALPIVPMFHANAWGMPYAALMAGADLVLPDRYLDAGRWST